MYERRQLIQGGLRTGQVGLGTVVGPVERRTFENQGA